MVFAPEAVPVVRRARVEGIYAGENRAEVGPVAPVGDEFGALGVGQDVGRDLGEGVVGAFRIAKHVVVGLSLKGEGRSEQRVPLSAKPSGGEALVGGFGEAEPEKVGVIRHEAVGGAGEGVAVADVEQEFAKRGVMSGVEPAGGTVLQSHRPVDAGAAAVAGGVQAGKAGVGGRKFGFHAG